MTPKFANTKQSFHVELKKRINQYFETTGKEMTGCWRLIAKALFLVTALIYIYVHLVFFTPNWTMALLYSAMLGFISAAIIFTIMHGLTHGSFRNYKWLNNILSNLAEFVGASQFMWN